MLDIGVGDTGDRSLLAAEPTLGFEDDGYYWFLHPLFERLATETGQYIDLYGKATFASADLGAMSRMLTEARALVEAQPATWQVHTGTQLLPTRREVYTPVGRVEFLELLATWEQVVARAQSLERPVVCFGD